MESSNLTLLSYEFFQIPERAFLFQFFRNGSTFQANSNWSPIRNGINFYQRFSQKLFFAFQKLPFRTWNWKNVWRTPHLLVCYKHFFKGLVNLFFESNSKVLKKKWKMKEKLLLLWIVYYYIKFNKKSSYEEIVRLLLLNILHNKLSIRKNLIGTKSEAFWANPVLKLFLSSILCLTVIPRKQNGPKRKMQFFLVLSG